MNVGESQFNFLAALKLSDLMERNDNKLDYNHDFCFEMDELNTSRKFRPIASVASTSNGIKMTVSTTYPCVHVNMGSRFNGISGKANHVYDRYSAFTLQCRGLSDAINQPHYPSIILRSDELYQQLTIYRFGLDDE